MSKAKGLDQGVVVHVLRIPEEASQELTGERAKYAFCVDSKAREDLMTKELWTRERLLYR